jgi:hypothetical protein
MGFEQLSVSKVRLREKNGETLSIAIARCKSI